MRKEKSPAFRQASETGASEQDDVITETLRSQKRNACVREVGQVSVVPQIVRTYIMNVDVYWQMKQCSQRQFRDQSKTFQNSDSGWSLLLVVSVPLFSAWERKPPLGRRGMPRGLKAKLGAGAGLQPLSL